MTTGPTRRELSLLIFLVLGFGVIFQLDSFATQHSDGSRSLLGVKYSSPVIGGDGGEGREEYFGGKQGGEGWEKTNKLGVGLQMKETLEKFGDDGAPRTKVLAHAPGWTIFSTLYLLNSTWYIVVDNPQDIPLLRLMTSTGGEIWNDEESIAGREPSDKDMKIIFPSEAKRRFGTAASKVDGTTWLVNDPPQFLDHYYHFAAELLFGLWRTYSALDPNISPTGVTSLPSPSRLIFSHTEATKWKDYSKMNTFLLHSAFPSMSYEYMQDFQDRADAGRPYVFDRVVFADRAAAFRGPQFQQTWRTASEAFTIPGSLWWWAPVRRNILEFVGGVPESTFMEHDVGPPVITYVSRQEWGRRMLKKKDHEALVEELYRLQDTYGYEVNIVSMDQYSRDEQLRLAARTTIMLGVHGNGLTHLLWMKPTPRATVIEFFYPQGFAQDYEFTSRALGITHFGFWNDEHFTAPDTPEINYPEGFQGNEIPIDGKKVGELIHQRLSIPVLEDEVEEVEHQLEESFEEEPVELSDEDDEPINQGMEEGTLR